MAITMTDWRDVLRAVHACDEALTFAEGYDSFQAAWDACERGDWMRARITPLSNGCWLWNRRIEPNGYGRVYFKGRMYWAHRLVFELLRGSVPEGYELDHLCRVRRCVNPHHLEPVSHTENMRRSPIGASVGHRLKTQCPQGHPYSGNNLIVYRNMRYCRQCQQQHKRNYKQK